MRRTGRILLRVAIAAAILGMICVIAGVLVLRSGWFRERVRERIVQEIEKSTGGRAELGNFEFNWRRMVATVGPLAIHGKEPAADPPLLTIASVSLGLKIISALERKVDLASLDVERPMVRVVVYPDGSTNLPSPGTREGKSWAGAIVDLAVRRYNVTNGAIEYDNRKAPLNLHGENLQLAMTFEPAGLRYRGQFSSNRLRMVTTSFGPVEGAVSADFLLDPARVVFPRLHLETGASRFDLVGTLEDLKSPHGTFTVKASVPVREAVVLFDLPVAPAGAATFSGRLNISFADKLDYTLSGKLNARGIGYSRDRLKIAGAEVQADLTVVPEKVTLRGITATALGSNLTGDASLLDGKQFHFEGDFDGLSVRQAASIATDRQIAWNGTLSGSLRVDTTLGKPDAKLDAHVDIRPAADGTPVQGQIDAAYDQASGKVRLGNSWVATPGTRADVSGTLGETLQLRARSTNLDDLLPVLAMSSANSPAEIPIKLVNGSATFIGTVAGSMDDPHVSGQIDMANAAVEGHRVDRFSGEVQADLRDVRVQKIVLSRGATQVEGSATIAAVGGKFDDGAITGQLTIRNASLAELSKEAGVTTEISGTAAGTVRISGTVTKPEADATVQIEKPAAFNEQADRLRATVRYSPTEIDVSTGQADAGPSELTFQGSFQHAENDWNSGSLRFDVSAADMEFKRSQTLAKLQPLLDGKVTGKANGAARIVNREVVLDSLTGQVSGRGLTWDQQALGDVNVTAETRGQEMSVRADASSHGATVQGQGTWRLTGDLPGSATFRFARINVATLHELVMIAGTPEERQAAPPVDGFIEGGGTLTIELRKPADFRGEVTLDTVQINGKPNQTLQLGVQAQDLVIKNAKPIVIALSANEAKIASAQLTARETNLEASGTIPFGSKASADLSVRGSVNLAILQLLSPDLLARGNATVEVSIRGSITNPQLNGRMDLKNASLYVADVPTGLDSVNGSVRFDRNRATIDKLAAEIGGGKVNFGGFVEFSSVLVYRLQGDAQNVRIRYEDVSVTLNSKVALNGTSDASTLSGVLTLNKATVSARADLGQLLASFAKPAPAPSPNEYLRGMQFDIRIDSGPNFELQTSLTRDVETEVNLRLRGTPLRPTLLGTISVSQGEVEVFGNRYTINRGDIRFLNPLKTEPTMDLNLETKARGITVNIAVSGTAQKLNVNYSSDPPLQSREIIALLAVGRAPSATGGLATTTAASGSSFADAGGGLLGQALSQQLQASRLQRFFGASRVKIDPTLTGVDYLPQARLTLEQQVSKEITLTYVTNLNRTQEQIVQVQWDISQRWSAIAIREASGLFGIDIQYKKSFK